MMAPNTHSRVRRGDVLRLIGIGSAAALVTACAQPVTPQAPASAAAQPGATSASAPASTVSVTSQPATEQPKTGGTLEWGLLGNIVTLDGHNYAGTSHIFLTLAKNPNYWHSGLPYVDQLHMPIFSDPQTMVTALESGSLDAAVNVPIRDAARLQQDTGYQVLLNKNSGAMYGIIANTTVEPTAQKAFRQALQYAIDRQRIAETVLLGLGDPTELVWFPTSPAYDVTKNRTYTFDLDKARSLLQQAALSDASIDFNYSTAIAEFGSMAQIIQADLQKIGVTLNLKPTDPPQLAQMQYQVKYPGISAGTPLFGQAHPGVQFGSPYCGPLNNWTGLKNDQFTMLSTAMSTAVDPSKGKQAYAAWNDYVLDQSFVLGIATFLPRMCTTARVHGVHYDLAYILDGTEAWLA